MPKIKAVLDTNIFVRALLGSAANEAVYNAFKEDIFILVVSKEILEELAEVLLRPALGLDLKNIKSVLSHIKEKAVIAETTQKIKSCRDPKDDMILEAAVNAKADIIVSNDKDLLDMNPFKAIQIVEPRRFLEILCDK
jgi:uncharacterized protein